MKARLENICAATGLFMQTYTVLTVDDLEKYRNRLVKFSELSKENLQDIYIKPNEKFLGANELEELVYAWNIPLYAKMIFRLIQCEHSAPAFYRQIDSNNQVKLVKYFNLHKCTRAVNNGSNADNNVNTDADSNIQSKSETDEDSRDYKEDNTTSKENISHSMIDFFAWMKHQLGAYDITELEGMIFDAKMDYNEFFATSKFIPLWRANVITFYFDSLDNEQKAKLIVRYNLECVIPWLKHLEEGK